MKGKKSDDHVNDALTSIKSGHFIQTAFFMFEDHYKNAKDKMTAEQQQEKVNTIAETIEMIFKERYIALRAGESLSDGEADEVYKEARHALGLEDPTLNR